ncbi:unnamed protein product, partial [marine sediment metagenome]
ERIESDFLLVNNKRKFIDVSGVIPVANSHI